MQSAKTQPCKLIVVGDAGAGKTSLQDRWVRGKFPYEAPCCNIAVDFATKRVRVGEHVLNFQLWDTCGQERYQNMSRSYFRGADAALIAYDITSSASFNSLEEWFKLVEDRSDAEVVVALVGCKSDLEDRRQVDSESALALAAKYGCSHMETSARKNQHVDALFESIANNVCDPCGKGRPFAKSSVLTLEIDEESLGKLQSAKLSARSMSGEVVAKVDADLQNDTILTLKDSIARHSQAKLSKRLSIAFGTLSWDIFPENTKLITCLKSSGWQKDPETAWAQRCVLS